MAIVAAREKYRAGLIDAATHTISTRSVTLRNERIATSAHAMSRLILARAGVLCACLLSLLQGCESRDEIPASFVGTWQSNKQLTLESMRQSTLVDADARAVFEDDFFGRLVVDYRQYEGRSYFVDADERPEFEPHDIVDSGPNFVIFRVPDNEKLGLDTERTWYVDGDLMIVRLDEWGFVEVFMRIEE